MTDLHQDATLYVAVGGSDMPKDHLISDEGARQRDTTSSPRLDHDPNVVAASPVLRAPTPGKLLPHDPPARGPIGRGGKPPTTALGARLRDLRVNAGFNQREMAHRIGYKTPHGGGRVSEYEVGHHTPTLSTLYAYATVFGITVSELLADVL